MFHQVLARDRQFSPLHPNIGDADVEHWREFRENLDKLTVSFVIAGTDDESPHSKEDVLPLFGQLLSQLCEAFEQV